MNSYPSVTTVLRIMGFYDDMDLMPAANSIVGKARGSALHKAAHYLALGQEPPWKEPHPELDCFLDGFREFLRQHEWRIHDHESEWVNEAERLVAHPDEYGILDGKLTVLEIKTGVLPAWVGLQLSGQLIARRMGIDQMQRMALSLPGNHSYRLVPQTNYRDFAEFRCLLQAVHVRAKYQGEFWRHGQ